MEIQVLKVHHYGESEAEDRRIVLSPQNLLMVASGLEDVVIRGRTLATVSILDISGNCISLNLSHADLATLESAIGSYCLQLD